ncbi:MAG: response regulator [Planctomycetaceae bacterium]
MSDTATHTEQPGQPVSGSADIEVLLAELTPLAECAIDTRDEPLSATLGTLIDLLKLAESFRREEDAASRADEIVEFCRTDALPRLRDCGGQSQDLLQDIRSTAIANWGDFLELLSPNERFSNVNASPFAAGGDDPRWDELVSETTQESFDEEAAVAGIDLASVLASLGNTSVPKNKEPVPAALPQSSSEKTTAKRSQGPGTPATSAEALPAPDATDAIDDPELLAAFIDDAQQCLQGMEATLLDLDSGQQPAELARQFCRELHTLKGASGTVGLSNLAAWLHGLEDRIEAMAAAGRALDVDLLLGGIDVVREQLTTLTGTSSQQGSAVAASLPSLTVASGRSESATENRPVERPQVHCSAARTGEPATAAQPELPSSTTVTTPDARRAESAPEHFIRLEASRLDQLMDLLAELVMLRNRRDTYVTTLRDLQRELNGCAKRLRSLNASTEFVSASPFSRLRDRLTAVPQESAILPSRPSPASSMWLSRSLSELANDVTELGRSVHEVSEPLYEDNSAVKHLIGRFRQELMDLRRLPVSGLFQRLQRSVRDAAKTEGRSVELRMIGQGTRVDRSLQERLFEPLMHIVRNAVSHGIESPDERSACGKPAAGTLTLQARSDMSHLHIEVHDDGRGLNDEQLEHRGRELGLLPVGQTVSREQLWKLIFHPGFSTRTGVSRVSGRGVGMDVVDSWVRRLRGRIDIESTTGQGTTFRLQIPLRSAIEHAMVVRVGGQLFALPMHAVEQTSTGQTDQRQPVLQLGELLGLPPASSTRRTVLSLRSVQIAVDEVVGVEEVVVRSLPSMLTGHELFAGVTLSGQAETVLLLDVPRLIERAQTAPSKSGFLPIDSPASERTVPTSTRTNTILITDDSVTIRRTLSRKLAAHGYSTAEADDGFEAMKRLRAGGISAVITDIDMPRTSGLELLAEIKASERFAEIPVIIVSSRDDAETAASIQDLKAAALLHKPVTETTVTQIVELLSRTLQTSQESRNVR